MSVAAAIRITSAGQEHVITRASEFARQQGQRCYVISVVEHFPFGARTQEECENAARNVELIHEANASPVMQEGSYTARTLLIVAREFGVQSLFVQSGTTRRFGRSVAEQLIYLDPPFDVVAVGSE